jgi:mannose-6-phosphate isomerase-like protein (cupin superfamily)
MSLTSIIDQLEKLEPQLRTIDQLYESGSILSKRRYSEVGDFRLFTWSNDFENHFTAGCLQRVRQDGNPFPPHVHDERVWILCSQGILEVHVDEFRKLLSRGEFVVIEPEISHSIHPISADCQAVFVTIPADAGFRHGKSS